MQAVRGVGMTLVVVLILVLMAVAHGAEVEASGQDVATALPSLSRQYTLAVSPLHRTDLDADTPATLIVVTEVVTVRVVETERVSFPDDFDPIWYYVARRRGLTRLEWSGCGGRWRPAWSVPWHNTSASPHITDNNTVTDDDDAREDMRRLRHYLAHHVVCSFSTVAVCGDDVDARATQFAWATQFISALTSSALSWTEHTPRHIRPVGLLVPRATGLAEAWCSYHHVSHDTVCTQHITHWLNAGRAGHDLTESLPAGIFRAALGPFFRVLGTPFHHFEVKLTQRPYTTRQTGVVGHEVRVRTRMSFVAVDEDHLAELAGHWADDAELASYADLGLLRVQLVDQTGVDALLRESLVKLARRARAPHTRLAAATSQLPEAGTESDADMLRQPEVSYGVHSHGADHAIFTLYLQPAAVTIAEDANLTALPHTAAARRAVVGLPREGDVLHSLVLFPLHLLRPTLHEMEAFLGQTRIEGVHVDAATNTLAVLLRTNVTHAHVAAYRAALDRAQRSAEGEPGVLLARLHLIHGWASLEDMPRDANSFRVLPQPVVLLQRPLPAAAVGARAEDCPARCAREVGVARIDHHSAALQIMQTLSPSLRNETDPGRGAGCTCAYWLRAVTVSGSLIPAPDPAMVFNVISLWAAVVTLTVGFIIRIQQRLTSRKDAMDAATNQVKAKLD